MKFQDVINRAIADPTFAAQLHEQAKAAARATETRKRTGGKEWEDLLRNFAESPQELAQLTGPSGNLMAGTTNTILTTFTVTSAGCFTTTTTTTTTTQIQ